VGAHRVGVSTCRRKVRHPHSAAREIVVATNPQVVAEEMLKLSWQLSIGAANDTSISAIHRARWPFTRVARQTDVLKKMAAFDDELIARNLSPGGSADLLIVTAFLAKFSN